MRLPLAPLRPLPSSVHASVVGLALMLILIPAVAKSALTAAEVNGLVFLHNFERCVVDPTAASMSAVTWNPLLAGVAQNWASDCAFGHNSNRSADYLAAGGSGYVGENIAWGTNGFFSPIDLAQLWADEKAIWTYGPIDFSTLGESGHYTQIVWANTTTIGCGEATCGGDSFVVCNYAVGGNFLGLTPYALGSGPNQACPEPGVGVGVAAACIVVGAAGRTPRRRRVR